MPDRRALVDAVLTDFAVSIFQQPSNFIATQVFPAVPVAKESAQYPVFSRESFMRSEMRRRPNGGRSARADFDMSTDTYTCEVESLDTVITERDRRNWMGPGTIEESKIRFLVSNALQGLERRFASDCLGTGKWGTDLTGVAASPSASQFVRWDIPATSDPIEDVDRIKLAIHSASGLAANTMVMDYATWLALKRHPLIIDRVTGGATSANPAMVTRNTVAAVFEIERLLVSMGVGATNVENETLATSSIAGKGVLICHTSPTPDMATPSAGYTFTFDATEGANPLTAWNYEAPEFGRNTVVHEIEMGWDNKITSTVLGGYLSGTVS